MNEQDKTTTPSQPTETQTHKKEEPNSTSSGKRGRKMGGGTGKERKSNPSFLEIRQAALEALISLPEGGRFHLSYQTADEEDKAINYWS